MNNDLKPDERLPTEPEDFSLVLGGPLFQLWQRSHMAGDGLQLLHRRVIVLATIAWLPLLVLSVVEGHAWGSSVALPFVRDIEVHARLLLAMPLLIFAELTVHQRFRSVVRQFIDRGLVPPAGRARFDAAIAAAMRLRNSITAEVAMLAFVYVVGVAYIWRTQVAVDASSWYGVALDGKLQPSLAGWWLGCVSLPVFQFLLLRWYFRLFIWARFLWQVARIELTLIPTHPDRCGGLGFLAAVGHALSPVFVAQGVMLAGVIANKIFYTGAKLPDFKMHIAALVVITLLALLGPLFAFAPVLAGVRRTGLREYGTLAQGYVRSFDHKWLRGGAPPDEPLIGSADIQSLADLNNSFEVVTSMRFAPITFQAILQLAVMTVLPFAPLLLTMFSAEELLTELVKTLF
jgi:hypothetical protein